jgi:hypothetical protein
MPHRNSRPRGGADVTQAGERTGAMAASCGAASILSVRARPPGRSTFLPRLASSQCPGASSACRSENGNVVLVLSSDDWGVTFPTMKVG